MSSSSLKIAGVIAAVVVMGGVVTALAGVGAPETTEPTTPEAIQPTSTSSSPTTTMPTSTSTLPTTTTTTPSRETLVIHGTGDVNLDPDHIPALAEHGYEYAWEELGGLFLDDDITVINLECTPSDLGVAEPKEFVFRCPTDSLPSLRKAGVDVANMGNNHSGDYGKEALVDGRNQLIAAEVTPVGAGVDASQAEEGAILEVDGWKVAVVGFGGVVPTPEWVAGDDRPGMGDGDDIASMVATVERADDIADVVVVTIHWGVELDTQPRPDDVARAEAMVDAGADVIFGHHAHRLQPVEMIDDAAVFWGSR